VTLQEEIELTILRKVIEEGDSCSEAAKSVILTVHDYLFKMADSVSNLRKPYTDNDYGRAAAIIMRCWFPERIDDILNSPPYK